MELLRENLRLRAEEKWVLQPAPIRPERQLLFEDQACPVAWVAGITPMDPQKEIMQTLLRAIAGGFDALIDSPTGTGKTYALLCAALAAQHQHRQRQIDALEAQVAAAAAAFAAQQQQQQAELQQLQQQQQQPAAAAATAADGATANADGTQPAEPLLPPMQVAPPPDADDASDPMRVFCLTRTHTQRRQMVKALRNVPYQVKIASLAARKHHCQVRAVKEARNGGSRVACMRKRQPRRLPARKRARHP